MQPTLTAKSERRRLWFWPLLGLMLLSIIGGLIATMVREHFSPTVLETAHADAKAHGKPLTKHVVIIVADSLRYDLAFDPEMFPYLNSIKSRGAWGRALAGDITMTGISTHMIGAGHTPGLTNIVRNWQMPPVRFETVFDLIKKRGGKIALDGNKPWAHMYSDRLDYNFSLAENDPRFAGIFNTDQSDNLFLAHLDPALAPPEVAEEFARRKGELEQSLAGAHDPDERADIQAELEDNYPHGRTKPLLPNDEWTLLIIHFVGTDHLAHRVGVFDDLYKDKLNRLDKQLEQIFKRLTPDTTVLFMSDHGCTDNGRHGSAEEIARSTPIFMFGPGIKPGVSGIEMSLLDYSPTLSALLGLPIAAPAEGRIVTEALDVSDAQKAQFALMSLKSRVRYLSKWREAFGRNLDLPTAKLKDLEKKLKKGTLPPAAVVATVQALHADLNQNAAKATKGSNFSLGLWVLLGCAGALSIVVLGRRRAQRVPPIAFFLCLGIVISASLGMVFARATLPLVLVALVLALTMIVILTRDDTALPLTWSWPRLRVPVLTVLALIIYEVLAFTLFVYEGRLRASALFTALPKPIPDVIYYVLLWGGQGIAAILIYRARARWLPTVRRHPMLFGGTFIVVLTELEGYMQVIRYTLIAGVITVGSYLSARRDDRGSARVLPLVGCLAFLGMLFAWMMTWEPAFFGLDIRRFNLDVMTIVNLGLVGLFLWIFYRRRVSTLKHLGRQARGLLGLAAALLLLPFLLRAIDSDALFRTLMVLEIGVFLWIPLSRAHSDVKATAVELAALSLYLLLCFDREFQVAMLIMCTLVMLYVFDAKRWQSDTWVTCLFLAIATLSFRVVLFGIFEQKFNFTSVEVTAGFLGNKSLNIYWATATVFLKFMAPFVLVIAFAHRQLTALGLRRTTLVILFLFTARLIQIVVLFLFTMNQYYTSWRLIGELFFYSMFLVTYCLATGIYVLVRRPAIAPVRDTGALRLAQIQQQQ